MKDDEEEEELYSVTCSLVKAVLIPSKVCFDLRKGET